MSLFSVFDADLAAMSHTTINNACSPEYFYISCVCFSLSNHLLTWCMRLLPRPADGQFTVHRQRVSAFAWMRLTFYNHLIKLAAKPKLRNTSNVKFTNLLRDLNAHNPSDICLVCYLPPHHQSSSTRVTCEVQLCATRLLIHCATQILTPCCHH